MPTPRQRLLLMGRRAEWTPVIPLSGVSPIVWLKADSIVGSDNDPVAAWNSTLPATFNAAQAVAGQKPLYKVNILNGLPGILFDNTDDCLTGTLNLSAYGKLTVFAVFSAAAGQDSMVCELGNAVNTNGAMTLYRALANTVACVNYTTNTANRYANYITSGSVTTIPKVVCFTHDKSLSSLTVTGWLNGVTGGTRSVDQDTIDNFGNLTFNIGSRSNGASFQLNGYIHEILIYPGIVLSNEERIKVETYLNKKWVLFSQGVVYADNAYAAEVSRSDTGTFIRTSPAARLVYRTDAETAYLDTYNDIYGTYPQFTEIGVKVDGADLISIDPGALGTVPKTVDLGVGANKLVEFINGAQSKPGATTLGTYVCGVTFNKPATLTTPSSSPRLLIYGDSIAVGANSANPSLEGWAQLVRNSYPNSMLLEAWGYRTLYDDGATAGARTTFAVHIAAQNPALIWLAIGVNDYALDKWSAADFGIAYADLLDKLHTTLPDAVIYAQTPIVRTVGTERTVGWGDLAAYRTAIGTAQSTRTAYCNLVDGTALMAAGGLDDGVHPTTAGHATYAASVKTILGI